MSRSRHDVCSIVDGSMLSLSSFPFLNGIRENDLFENIRTFEYRVNAGDRMDNIAARFFDEPQYWWIIALGNGIRYPFSSGGFVPGKIIRVPFDVKDVIDRLLP